MAKLRRFVAKLCGVEFWSRGGELVSPAGLFERRSVRVSVAICVLGVGFAILDAETNGTRCPELAGNAANGSAWRWRARSAAAHVIVLDEPTDGSPQWCRRDSSICGFHWEPRPKLKKAEPFV